MSKLHTVPSVPEAASHFDKRVVVISCTIGERRGQMPLPDTEDLHEAADVTSVFIVSCR